MTTTSAPSFGEILRRHRVEAGLTQEELAERANLSARGISDLERGLKKRPHPGTIQFLAEALELSDEERAALAGAARPGRADQPATDLQRQIEALQWPRGDFLGAMPERVLVGRDPELAQIGSVLEAVMGGKGQLVALAGEAGAGKTRLAQEVTIMLREHDFVVATGRCHELEQGIPYYPWVEALSSVCAAAPPSLADELPRRWPYLGRLLPAQFGTAALAPGQDAEEQQRLFWSMTDFLLAVAAERPLALLMDDLHWADDASLKVLHHIARNVAAHRVLLVVTYRDAEVGPQHVWRRAELELQRAGAAQRITLDGLEEPGVTALIADVLGDSSISDEFTRALTERTSGNPFYVTEVVRSLVESGDVYRDAGEWRVTDRGLVAVPETVRAVVEQRLARLDERVREVLSAASVLGASFYFEELLDVSGETERNLETALEDAGEAAFTQELTADSYRFHHALIQHALYEGLSRRRRRQLHLRAADMLEPVVSDGEPHRVAELVAHLVEAGADSRALPYALAAGDHAQSVFAHDEAERQYRLALELARGQGDAELEMRALEGLGRVLHTVARFDEALDALDHAAAAYRGHGDIEGEARLVAQMGRVHKSRGTPQMGLDRLEALAERLPPGESGSAYAGVQVVRARLFSAMGRLDEQLAAAATAAESARAVGDTSLLAEAELSRGTALFRKDQVEEGLSVWQHAIPLAEEANRFDILQALLGNVSLYLMAAGNFGDSRRYADRALELAGRIGDPAAQAAAVIRLGEISFYQGRWEEAQAHYERAADLVRALGLADQLAYVSIQLGRLSLARGDWRVARTLLERASVDADINQDPQALRWAQTLLAELDARSGHPQAALDRLLALFDRPIEQQEDVTYILPTAAWVHLEAGNLGRAEALASEAVARATREHDSVDLADALRIQGMIAVQKGLLAEGKQRLDEALTLAASMRYASAEAYAHYAYGRVLGKQGESAQARDQLLHALSALEQLGAAAEAKRVAAELSAPPASWP